MALSDKLSSGYYNSNAFDAVANPGGLGKGGHRTNFPAALSDVGSVAKKVGDDAAIANAAAAQSGSWNYEVAAPGVGNVLRLSDTKVGIRSLNRLSIYLSRPYPRALRLIQSKVDAVILMANNQFQGTAWTAVNVAATDGNAIGFNNLINSAALLAETANSGTHILSTPYAGYSSNESMAFSVAMHAGARSKGVVAMGTSGNGNSISLAFDLTAGTVGTVTATGTATAEVGGIIPLGNGWYRPWIAGKISSASAEVTAQIQLADGTGALSYLGVAGQGILVQDAAFHRLQAQPSQDNAFMYVLRSEWNASADMTEVTVLNGYVAPNFGAYPSLETDGLYYAQDPTTAPRGGSAAAKMYAAREFGAVGFNW